MHQINGVFDGKVFVPDDAVDLPTGQRVTLQVTPLSASSRIQGVQGSTLLDLAGTISKADADEMLNAIEHGCERVDANGW